MFIAVQWTSSAFHAWLLADGRVVAEHTGPRGVNGIADGDFAGCLKAEIGPWLERAEMVLLSGMVTSRNGWVETPYAAIPAGAADLADAALPRTVPGLPPLVFLPGVAQHEPRPDVMRGEELDLIGTGISEGTLVLPGPHSKWVQLSAGRVSAITTYMSGEIARLLKADSIVGKLLPAKPEFDREAFLLGAKEASAGSGGILGIIFSTRSLVLFGQLSAGAAASYLDGLLIGAEIAEALNQAPPEPTVTILGDTPSAAHFELALASREVAVRRLPATPYKGFVSVYNALREKRSKEPA